MTLAALPILPGGKSEFLPLTSSGGMNAAPIGTADTSALVFQLLLLAQNHLPLDGTACFPDGILPGAALPSDGPATFVVPPPAGGDLSQESLPEGVDALPTAAVLIPLAPMVAAEIPDLLGHSTIVANDDALITAHTDLLSTITTDSALARAVFTTEILAATSAMSAPPSGELSSQVAADATVAKPIAVAQTTFAIPNPSPGTQWPIVQVDEGAVVNGSSQEPVPTAITSMPASADGYVLSVPPESAAIDAATDSSSLGSSPDDDLALQSESALRKLMNVVARTTADTAFEMTVTSDVGAQPEPDSVTRLVPASRPSPVGLITNAGHASDANPSQSRMPDATAPVDLCIENAQQVEAAVPLAGTSGGPETDPQPTARLELPNRLSAQGTRENAPLITQPSIDKPRVTSLTGDDRTQAHAAANTMRRPGNESTRPLAEQEDVTVLSKMTQGARPTSTTSSGIADLPAAPQAQSVLLSANQSTLTQGEAPSETTPTRFIVEPVTPQSSSGHITVRLEPPELGLIRIDLTSGPEGVVGRLRIHAEATRSAVERDITHLRQSLAEAGVRVDRLEVASISRTVDAVWANPDDALSRLTTDRTPVGRSLTQDNPGENPWRHERQRRHRGTPFEEPSPWVRWTAQYATGVNVVA